METTMSSTFLTLLKPKTFLAESSSQPNVNKNKFQFLQEFWNLVFQPWFLLMLPVSDYEFTEYIEIKEKLQFIKII